MTSSASARETKRGLNSTTLKFARVTRARAASARGRFTPRAALEDARRRRARRTRRGSRGRDRSPLADEETRNGLGDRSRTSVAFRRRRHAEPLRRPRDRGIRPHRPLLGGDARDLLSHAAVRGLAGEQARDHAGQAVPRGRGESARQALRRCARLARQTLVHRAPAVVALRPPRWATPSRRRPFRSRFRHFTRETPSSDRRDASSRRSSILPLDA